MTGFAALVTSSLALILLGFTQVGQLIAFHQSLQFRAETLAVRAAAQLHKGEDACTQMPDFVLSCAVDGNVAYVVVGDQIQLFGRQFTLKYQASVANQWAEFTDDSVL
jgi:hypothetical protein